MGKGKIEITTGRKISEALALMAADFSYPWPRPADIRRYALWLRQASEAILSTEDQINDTTELKYTVPDEANPEGAQRIGGDRDRDKPPVNPDCDKDIQLYIA